MASGRRHYAADLGFNVLVGIYDRRGLSNMLTAAKACGLRAEPGFVFFLFFSTTRPKRGRICCAAGAAGGCDPYLKGFPAVFALKRAMGPGAVFSPIIRQKPPAPGRRRRAGRDPHVLLALLRKGVPSLTALPLVSNTPPFARADGEPDRGCSLRSFWGTWGGMRATGASFRSRPAHSERMVPSSIRKEGGHADHGAGLLISACRIHFRCRRFAMGQTFFRDTIRSGFALTGALVGALALDFVNSGTKTKVARKANLGMTARQGSGC